MRLINEDARYPAVPPGEDLRVVFFLTLVCHRRECRLGHIRCGVFTPWPFGLIVEEEWIGLSDRFPYLSIGPYQVMPNHFHALISVPGRFAMQDGNSISATHEEINLLTTTPRNDFIAAPQPLHRAPDTHVRFISSTSTHWPTTPWIDYRPPVLSTIIGSYKSLTSLHCLRHHKQATRNQQYTPLMGRLWQRGYYARFLRTSEEVRAVTRYIMNNPRKWNGHD
jgi:REP element-mobilizing transposase RayT